MTQKEINKGNEIIAKFDGKLFKIIRGKGFIEWYNKNK